VSTFFEKGDTGEEGESSRQQVRSIAQKGQRIIPIEGERNGLTLITCENGKTRGSLKEDAKVVFLTRRSNSLDQEGGSKSV